MISTVFGACGYLYIHLMTWQKKYRWVPTWPGEGHEDWCGWDGKIRIGRVMRDLTTPTRKDMFLWSGGAGPYAGFKHRLLPHQGWVKEHWQAAKAVEDWYDQMREMNGMPAIAAPTPE